MPRPERVGQGRTKEIPEADDYPIQCKCGCECGEVFELRPEACARFRVDCKKCFRFIDFLDEV